MNVNKVFKKRYRRRLSQFEQIGYQTTENFENNFIKRLKRLRKVRKFTFLWVLGAIIILFGLTFQILNLSNYFQTSRPVDGGIYKEGILGDYSNINPIYASSPVDESVSRLVFSGLMQYNTSNKLVPALAQSYSVDSTGTIYTFKLKPNLVWQDGKSITSKDVAYTFDLIKTPDAQSPLISSWQGIKISTPDQSTVVFTLPNPLSSFIYSATIGILPYHILGNIAPATMRTVDFDTISPIGSGPFSLNAINSNGSTIDTKKVSIELIPFNNYWQGRPKINKFIITAYHSKNAMINDFKSNTVDSMSGLESVPSTIKNTKPNLYSFPLTAAYMVFFKTTSKILSDKNVRQALVMSADQKSIINSLDHKTSVVTQPFLSNQFTYNTKYSQAQFDLNAAANLLNSNGWIIGSDGYRYKNNQQLAFTLTVPDSPEIVYDATILKNNWKSIGVNLRISALGESDLQNSLSYHSYDAIIYGISIGVDPDEFIYWDSSQIDPRSAYRLNLSEYSSKTSIS